MVSYTNKGYRLSTKTIDNLAKIKEESGLSYNMLFTSFINNYMNVKSVKKGGKVEWSDIKEGEECPYCKSGAILKKSGRYGSFWACSNFPNCGFTQNIK